MQAHITPAEEALARAQELYAERPLWTDFYRHIFRQLFAELFPTAEVYRAFTRSPQYKEIVALVHDLRHARSGKAASRPRHRVITVRLPAELHADLIDQAHRQRVSLNTLCVGSLLHTATDPTEPVPNIAAKGGQPKANDAGTGGEFGRSTVTQQQRAQATR